MEDCLILVDGPANLFSTARKPRSQGSEMTKWRWVKTHPVHTAGTSQNPTGQPIPTWLSGARPGEFQDDLVGLRTFGTTKQVQNSSFQVMFQLLCKSFNWPFKKQGVWMCLEPGLEWPPDLESMLTMVAEPPIPKYEPSEE